MASDMYDGKLYVADSRAPGLVRIRSGEAALLARNRGRQRPNEAADQRHDRRRRHQVRHGHRAQPGPGVRPGRPFLSRLRRPKGEFKPVDTAIAGERLYVVDIQHHQVQVLDKRTGQAPVQVRQGRLRGWASCFIRPTSRSAPTAMSTWSKPATSACSASPPEGKSVRIYGEVGHRAWQFLAAQGHRDRPYRAPVCRRRGVPERADLRQRRQAADVLRPARRQGRGAQPAGGCDDRLRQRGPVPRYADPRFSIEYLILVVSQFGPNKVDVFGFGKMSGIDYPPEVRPGPRPPPKAAASGAAKARSEESDATARGGRVTARQHCGCTASTHVSAGSSWRNAAVCADRARGIAGRDAYWDACWRDVSGAGDRAVPAYRRGRIRDVRYLRDEFVTGSRAGTQAPLAAGAIGPARRSCS